MDKNEIVKILIGHTDAITDRDKLYNLLIDIYPNDYPIVNLFIKSWMVLIKKCKNIELLSLQKTIYDHLVKEEYIDKKAAEKISIISTEIFNILQDELPKEVIFKFTKKNKEENNTITVLSNEKYELDESKGIEYYVNNDGICKVIGIGTCTDSEIIIPKYIDKILITEISNSAFYKCANIRKIIIQNNIKKIGEAAFSECRDLEYVELAEGLENIGKGAFFDCKELKNINLPKSLKFIGKYAFSNCENVRIKVEQNTSSENYCCGNNIQHYYD